MGKMKELSIISDNEQGYCPTIEFLMAIAASYGEEVEDTHCNCKVCQRVREQEEGHEGLREGGGG